jgi:hypothetical protein
MAERRWKFCRVCVSQRCERSTSSPVNNAILSLIDVAVRKRTRTAVMYRTTDGSGGDCGGLQCQEPSCDPGTQKRGQSGDEQPQIVTGGNEERVDGVAGGDAFDLGGVEGVKLVGVTSALDEDPSGPFARHGKDGLHNVIAGDLAADVTVETAEPGAQLAHPAHRLLVTATMDQP